MRKKLSYLLLFLMCLALVGCNNKVNAMSDEEFKEYITNEHILKDVTNALK
jgi:hypothetical protein